MRFLLIFLISFPLFANVATPQECPSYNPPYNKLPLVVLTPEGTCSYNFYGIAYGVSYNCYADHIDEEHIDSSSGTCASRYSPVYNYKYPMYPTATCPSGQVPNPTTQICEVPPVPVCTPPSGMVAIPSLNQSMCVGSFTDLQTDGTGQSYGELIWQACDSTCYGVKIKDLTCADLEPLNTRICNGGNHLLVTCDETNSIGKINFLKTGCFPDINPCDTLYDQTVTKCTAPNHKVVGKETCTHSGMTVTNDTIKCVENVPAPQTPLDCSLKWYESFNLGTGQCECDSGYARLDTGVCSKILDSNATAEQIAANKEKDIQNALQQKQLTNDTNNSLMSRVSNTTQNNTLAGIRKDLNNTNALLAEIRDKNNSSSNNQDILDLFTPDDSLNPNYAQIDSGDLIGTIGNSITSIKDSFTTVSDNINNGFNINVSSGVDVVFSTRALNKDIQVNFSPFLMQLAPMFYYIFYLTFLILSIRIFYNGFKVGING